MNVPLNDKLTDEQVQNLLKEYALTKDTRIREKMVIQYKHLVESIARRFMNSGEPIEDLIQEGYIGLLTATDLYDTEKGVKFSTYATHFIIGQIKHALRDKGKIIKEPAWLQELNHRMTRVIDSLYQELGRQPTETEIGQVMHLPESTVAEILTTREVLKVTSLDNSQQDDSKSGGDGDIDRIPDEDQRIFQLPVEDRIVLETARNKLKLIEQKVIEDFYYKSLSQTEIAKNMGISCNYVSHILRNGTRKLRRILTTEEIKEVQVQLQLASRRTNSPADGALAEVVDSLTGTYNRQYLETRLEEEIMRAARDKTEVAFAVISIQGLDTFTSKFGNMRHDDALCAIVDTVKSSIRRCDILGRIGENELGIIMLHTKRRADQVCGRVLKAIQEIEFTVTYPKAVVKFDANIGYSAFPANSSNAAELIELARTDLENGSEELPKAA